MREHATRPIGGSAAASRRRRLRLPLGIASIAVLLAACGDAEQNALDPAGPFAQAPHDLIIPVAAIALFVFILVQGLIIYSVIKFRTRPDDDGSLPAQVHGNTRLEIFWTVIPAVILAVIAVPTVQGIFDIMDEPDEDFLTVEVIGHRWWFEYYYPDFDIYTANEIVIPVGTPVRLEMTAADPARSPDQGVLHSFWIPRLAGKQDMVPGQTTFLNIQADEPGRFLGQCAEYCGLSHANMRARAVAMDQADFDTWVEQQMTPAAVPDEGTLAAQGRELYHDLGDNRPACASCHQVWEDGSRGPNVGPDLTHLFSRQEFVGAIRDLDEENLRAWLLDPNSVKPMQYDTPNQIGMPNLDLTDEELDALVAYLMTLDPS
ncbi:MAG: cytochrome c oxidase subunit II [Nitriliruptoraceae bacterium]|nr:cytochrome c oxidase subunit II [Nitriliruptoraceae bacterium]